MAESLTNSFALNKRKSFRWSSEMIGDLLLCLLNCKTAMDFKGKDFDGGRSQQYSALRIEMSKKYRVECFGKEVPVEFVNSEELTSEKQKEQRDKVKSSEAHIRMGYN